MAMTKKERAEFDAAIERANMLGALRWSAPVKKDVPPPEQYKDFSSGWDCNAHAVKVYEVWSSSVVHGYGAQPDGRSASQNSIWCYSTRLLALMALRHQVELESAKKLAAIDKMIEAEMNGKQDETD